MAFRRSIDAIEDETDVVNLLGITLVISSFVLFLGIIQRDHEGMVRRTVMDRNLSVQAKGLAICMVVLTHAASTPLSLGALPGAIGVSLFLLLSGYGLHQSYLRSGLRKFWTKRLLSVFLVYWFVVVVGAAVRGQSGVVPLLKQLCLLEIPKGIHGWFLQHYVALIMAFYGTFAIFRAKQWQLGCLLVSSFLALLIPNVVPSLRNQQVLPFFVGVVLSFYAGTWDVMLTKPRVPQRLCAVALVFAVALYGACYVFSWLSVDLGLLGVVLKNCSLTISSLITMLFFHLRLTYVEWLRVFGHVCLRGLHVLGTVSYEFYLVHGMVWTAVKQKSPPACLFVYLFTALGASLVLAYTVGSYHHRHVVGKYHSLCS